MDSKDFENIYQDSKQIENTKQKDQKQNNVDVSVSNPRSEKIEKVTLSEYEELDRWYVQEDGDPNAFVEYKNFTWQRSKSNETITDTRKGKGGFSFYYAIHVFDDPYSITLPDTGHEDQDNGKRINTIGLAPGQDKTLVVTNADLDDNGKLRIISAILADSSNKSKLYDTYWKNRKIKSKFPPVKKLKDSLNNETFFVIRKAKGEKFDPTSYAKIVSRLDFDSAPNGDYAIYKGQPVFIQNYGTKSKCDSIQKMVKYELNHFGIGKDW